MSAYEVPTPKYLRVLNTIRERIESDKYPPGTSLPSENTLAKEFGVARPTVLKALGILRQDGWIESQQGKGHFVRGRPSAAGVSPQYAREALYLDETVSTNVVHVGRCWPRRGSRPRCTSRTRRRSTCGIGSRCRSSGRLTSCRRTFRWMWRSAPTSSSRTRSRQSARPHQPGPRHPRGLCGRAADRSPRHRERVRHARSALRRVRDQHCDHGVSVVG